MLTCAATWSALGARRRRALRRELWFVGFLTALALADRWLLGFPSKDLLFLQRELAAELASGEFLVSTATGLGKPLLAHPLLPVLTPFSPALALPWTDLAVHVFVTLHVVWGAAWWIVLLRERSDAVRGRDPWWPRAGAALVTLSGFTIARFGGQQGVEYALAAAWAPSLAFALQALVRGRGPWVANTLLAGLSASAALALCPNLFVGLLATMGFFVGACVIALPRTRCRVRALGRVAAAGALGAVMALPELLPTFEVLSANDGFTYRFDPESYRFRAYSMHELVHLFAGLGEVGFGRTALFGVVTLAGCGALVLARRRVRLVPLIAAGALLLSALDWAAHGLGYAALTTLVPAMERISIAPTVEAQVLWATVGVLATLSAPGRRRASLAALVLIVVGTGVATRTHRGRPGYDIAREARLFAWSEPLAGLVVADIQPVTERAYLLPDPVARARGIRTIGEDWYSLLPRPDYESLASRRESLPSDAALTLGPPPARGEWMLAASYDAYALAAEEAARDSLFSLCIRMMREETPGWDGRVAVYVPTGGLPDAVPASRDPASPGPGTLWLIWPGLLIAAAISSVRGRRAAGGVGDR